MKSLLEHGLQVVALLLTAFNILLTILVAAAIVLVFVLYVTKRQILVIQREQCQSAEAKDFL